MSTINFTDRWLKHLKPSAEGRVEYHDSNVKGLNLRVTSAGAMTWAVYYRVPGDRIKRRVTLGRYPAVPLAEARQQARKVLLDAARGQDPASEKRARKLAPIFADLATEYIERHASHKRDGDRDAELLRRNVLPSWGRLKAQGITRRDVVEMLDAIVDRGAPIAANRTLAVVRKLFNWAIGRDIVQNNPCHQVKAPGKENRRDRVLSEAEIAAFWCGLDTASMSDELKIAFKLLLVTAQRPGEVITAKWEEMDLAGRWWTIPAAMAKNGLAHRVPLSHLALELLEDLKRRTGDSPFLFPSPRGSKPIHEHALAKALCRNRESMGVEHFVPHDLRRTALLI